MGKKTGLWHFGAIDVARKASEYTVQATLLNYLLCFDFFRNYNSWESFRFEMNFINFVPLS